MVYLTSETSAEVSFYHFKENVFKLQCLCLLVYFLDLFQYIPSKSSSSWGNKLSIPSSRNIIYS